jgi:hypothetical protein
VVAAGLRTHRALGVGAGRLAGAHGRAGLRRRRGGARQRRRGGAGLRVVPPPWPRTGARAWRWR